MKKLHIKVSDLLKFGACRAGLRDIITELGPRSLDDLINFSDVNCSLKHKLWALRASSYEQEFLYELGIRGVLIENIDYFLLEFDETNIHYDTINTLMREWENIDA